MKLGSMIFRAILTSILASVFTLIAELVLNLIIPSDFQAVDTLINIFLAIFSSAAFATILTYLLQVYHGSGESEVWEDYPEKYNGVIRDIPLIVKKESSTLIFIFTLGGIELLLRVINANIFKSEIVNTGLSVFSPVTSLSRLFPTTAPAWISIGHLAGAFTTCLFYVIIFALFRWKWRRFM